MDSISREEKRKILHRLNMVGVGAYFNEVLNFPLSIDQATMKRLKMLIILRNTLVHSNGRIGLIKNRKHKTKIESWIRMDIGIMQNNGKLMFSEAFLKESCSIITESLRDLIHRVLKAFPLPENQGGIL